MLFRSGYHSGKNIWSTTVFGETSGQRLVICGGADSKISAHMLSSTNGGPAPLVNGYTTQDILSSSRNSLGSNGQDKGAPTHKSSKVADFFRSYAFIDGTSFLLTTNSGNVLLETLQPTGVAIAESKLISQLPDISGYSICVADSSLGIAFVAGSRGNIYMFQKGSLELSMIHNIPAKVGSMFIGRPGTGKDSGTIVLLATLMGHKRARLLYIDTCARAVSKSVELTLSEPTTGLAVTSMTYVSSETDRKSTRLNSSHWE